MERQDSSTGVLEPPVSAASDPEERRKGIGGSDVAALLGISPYKTPLDLYLQKKGLWEDEAAGEAALWGTIMEPILVREYVRRYECEALYLERGSMLHLLPGGAEIVEATCHPLLGTLVHPKHSWARGHVDAVGSSCDGLHIIETKTADLRLDHHWGDEDTDEIPESYLVQVMWYLMLTELGAAHVAVLIGGNRFRRYVVERDDALINLLLERAAEFWERVETGNAPDPEAGERGKLSLSRMYPADAGIEIEAYEPSNPLHQLARDLHAATVNMKIAEARKVDAQNAIKALMADASRVSLGNKTYIGWKNNKESVSTKWEDVAKDLADMLAWSPAGFRDFTSRYTTTKPGPRVFRAQGFDKLFEEG